MKTELTCMVVGSPGCGKTSFISRHTSGKFENIESNENDFSWMTTDGEFRISMHESDYPGSADVFIVMFELSSYTSFNFARECIERILDNNKSPVIALVATKIDASFKEIRGLYPLINELVRDIGFSYSQISSFTNYNIDQPILHILRRVSRNRYLTRVNDRVSLIVKQLESLEDKIDSLADKSENAVRIFLRGWNVLD